MALLDAAPLHLVQCTPPSLHHTLRFHSTSASPPPLLQPSTRSLHPAPPSHPILLLPSHPILLHPVLPSCSSPPSHQAEHTQLLKIIDRTGKTIYRVQLPQEGRTIFLGWEPSGAALAAVQDHGGAFLWFPSKPDCVQQWEGMQFSSQMLRSSSIKRNAHFDTCFASWSESRKLVLGLADGNFACWDLSSNETFISRKVSAAPSLLPWAMIALSPPMRRRHRAFTAHAPPSPLG